MSDLDIDRKLGALLRQDMPDSDPAFAERVLGAVRIEARLAAARRRLWRRLAADAVAAVALGLTFFLLSQEQVPGPSGLIPLQSPVAAGLVMLALWGFVSTPTSAASPRGHVAP